MKKRQNSQVGEPFNRLWGVDEEEEVIEISAETSRCATIDKAEQNLPVTAEQIS